jgi:VIT1/CCC1 family predicted Fe2+/Mn2+ transporter
MENLVFFGGLALIAMYLISPNSHDLPPVLMVIVLLLVLLIGIGKIIESSKK